MTQDATVQVSRVIPAEPQVLFDIVANPAMHPVMDGGGTVLRELGRNPGRLSLGAKFNMAMRIGLPYAMRNTVIEFDEGRRIAWHHAFRHVWRYEFEPVDGGTKVTETYDYGAGWMPLAYYKRSGFIKAAEASMPRTLERLEEIVAQRSSP